MEQILEHHGIKGMKWGVRRYQNPDGSLTSAGKKRLDKEYDKLSKKVVKDLRNEDVYIKSYNKAADRMNGGEIDKFNAQQKKKYGEKYADRDGYVEDYEKRFDKIFSETYNKSLKSFYDNNKNFQKAEELVKKYNMTSWNELAKNNESTIKELREVVSKYK